MAARAGARDRQLMRTSDAPMMTVAEYTARERELRDLRALREHEEDRTVLDARIAALEEYVYGAVVVPEDGRTDIVTIGREIEVEYLRTGRKVTLVVAGSGAAAEAGTVSAGSPVGRAVMGRRVGDIVVADLPGGWEEELRIVAIRLPG
jgi:transcription elongation factor GreA